MTKILLTLIPAVLIGGSAAAQQAPPPAPRPTIAAPAIPKPTVAPAPGQAVPPTPAEPPAPPAPPVHIIPVAPVSLDPTNVRVEIRLRDEGGADPGTKLVSMIATLGQVSSVRATAITAGRGNNPLNVDVMPSAVRDGKVHTRISIEYTPQAPQGTAGPSPLSVRQTVFAWLTDGTPTIVSQSSDPNSSRRLTVEVTAAVLK